MNVSLIEKEREREKKNIIATVSDIFDYVFNEGEYRVINNRERKKKRDESSTNVLSHFIGNEI